MKETSAQKELFKEFEAPKKKKRLSHAILPKNYTLFNVTYEQIIFITIAIIMLMVLIFSLGVERGKHLRIPASTQRVRDVIHKKEVKERIKDTEIEPIQTPIQTAVPTEEKRVSDSKLFTIQVIAYRSKKLAQKELMKLSKKGFKPFIIIGGGYYQICVGEYRNQNEAKKDISDLRKAYKDSFIRKR